ncbi:MAG: M50 family metallopeptidase, partial [Candidatus Omnitrophica bacterium]|nr:M50 family metallopeptidase [Candidatus Omnitrophota bacterium]
TDTTLGTTFIERIFGLSDLMISSQGAEQEIKFNNMVNGHEFLENVRSLIAQRKDTAAKDSVAKQIPSGREVRSPARARQPAVPADRSYTAEFKMHPLRTWLPVILATPLLIFVFPLWIVLIAGVIITLANTRFRVKSDAIERDFIVKSWYSYFFSRALRQFSLDKVTGIVFKENLLDKLTKTFSILFWSIGSGKDITFSNIKKEEGLKEKILAKKGIGQQKEIYRLTPRYTIFAMLKANIYLVGLAAIAVSVATIFFPPYGWISLPMAGLVFLATFIYRKIYYWNSLMVFYEDYVYFKRGIFFKQEYYVLYDDIRDITTTKYPLSNKGKITFNIAGETIIETKDGKFRFSNDFTVGYVDGISTLDELIDQIFFKRPSLEQIKAIEKNLKDTSTKPDYKAKPALTNYLAFIIPALLMINAGLIAAVNFMPQMVEELLVELPLALQSTQLLITAAGLLSIFIVVGVVIVIRSISYNFQPYRVFTRWGVIFKKQSSVTFDKIDFINFNQGPMNKLFGTGNIVISTTGSSEPQLVIRNIKDFKQFYNILKEDYHKPQSDPASSSSPTRAPPRLVRGDIVVWMIMVAGLIVASLGGLPQSWSLFLDKLALIAGLKIIPIIISPLALIPALFITYYVFKSTKKSRYLILVPLALVAIIFVHELGHALAATYFGAKVSAIELGMFGAVTKLAVVKGVPALSGLENILVYSAGPATHLLWIVPLVIFGRKSFGRGLIYYNLYLLVFNLLPFGLRDGGQIIALAKAVESISAYWFFTSLWAVIGLVSLIVFASSPTVKAGAKKLAAKVNIFPDVTVVKALVFVFALDFIFIVSVYSLPVGLLIALFSNLYLGLGIVLAASGLLALGIRILRKAAEAKVSLLRVALLALVVNVLADFTAAMIAPAITLPVLIAVQGLSFSGNIALSTAYVSSGLVAAVVMYYLINKAISALQTAVENKGLPLIRIALLILGADLLIFGLAALAAAFPAGLGLLAGILKGPLVSVGLTLGTAFAVSGLLLTGMGMSVIKAMVELINREDKTLGILVQEAFSSQSSSSTAAAEPAMESLRGPLSGNRVREMLKQRVKYDLEAKGVKLVEPETVLAEELPSEQQSTESRAPPTSSFWPSSWKVAVHLGLIITTAKIALGVALEHTLFHAFVPSTLVLIGIFFLWKDSNAYRQNRPAELLYIYAPKDTPLSLYLAVQRVSREPQQSKEDRISGGFADRGIIATISRVVTHPVTTLIFTAGGALIAASAADFSWVNVVIGGLFGFFAPYLLNILWNFFWSYMVKADSRQNLLRDYLDYKSGRVDFSDVEKTKFSQIATIAKQIEDSEILDKSSRRLQASYIKASTVFPALFGTLEFALGRLQIALWGLVLAEKILIPLLLAKAAGSSLLSLIGLASFEGIARSWHLPYTYGGLFKIAVIVIGLKLFSLRAVYFRNQIQKLMASHKPGSLDVRDIFADVDKFSDTVKDEIAALLEQGLVNSWGRPELNQL